MQEHPILRLRFKCLEYVLYLFPPALISNPSGLSSRCPDYDLCEKCYLSGVHPAEHKMIRCETMQEVYKAFDEVSGIDDAYHKYVTLTPIGMIGQRWRVSRPGPSCVYESGRTGDC